ncbi:unnamed protein product [Prunus armeniaca]|uniref:Transmembrane protein n=1 Tax=Prunus armeniaca TaxID=36596 RepID=A0A6J5XCS2_PRUAR|nr:unnamed protein product [Prunus armeniaca]
MAGLSSFVRFLIMVMYIASILLMHPSQIHADLKVSKFGRKTRPSPPPPPAGNFRKQQSPPPPPMGAPLI